MVLRFERTTSVLPAAATSRLIGPPPDAPSIIPLLLSTMQQPRQPSISMSLGRVSFAFAMWVSCSTIGEGGFESWVWCRDARRQHRRELAVGELGDNVGERAGLVDDGGVDQAASRAPAQRGRAGHARDR